MSNFEDRLLNEWVKHKKLAIACDFDGTIFVFNSKYEKQELCDFVIETLLEAQKLGTLIVINTASIPERFPFILEYCKEKGIIVEAINKNAIPFPYGNNGKVYSNIYLDDRAGINEALLILKNVIIRYKEHLNN